jgi:hypothetical protein
MSPDMAQSGLPETSVVWSAIGAKPDVKYSSRAFLLLTDTVEKVLVNFGEQ